MGRKRKYKFPNPQQLEFIFTFEKVKKAKVAVNYSLLYERLKKSPVTTAELSRITGRKGGALQQVITTLSLEYPVWCPRRGVYKLCEMSDYE